MEDCEEQLTPADFLKIKKICLEIEADPKETDSIDVCTTSRTSLGRTNVEILTTTVPIINTEVSILKAWAGFNRNLKNEIARLRAVKFGQDPAVYIREPKTEEISIADIVAQAAKAPDPLTAEKILDRFKWQYLDEIARWQYFNLEFLIVYALKLQILERYRKIEFPVKGKDIYQRYKKEVLEEEAVNI